MKELLKAPHLAKYLMVNTQTVYNWVNQKRIPFIKIGDLVRFDKEEIKNK